MPRLVFDRYDRLTIALHWAIALLIIGLALLGFVMTRPYIDPALQFSLFQWHKSFGMLALLLSAIRLLRSLLLVRVGRVAGVSRTEHRLAKAMHHALLLLALIVPLAGWIIASVSPLDIPTFAFNLFVIPHLPLPKSDAAEAWATTGHAVLAYLMLGLVALHSAAALYHHHRGHEVLMRMLRSRRHAVKQSVREIGQ